MHPEGIAIIGHFASGAAAPYLSRLAGRIEACGPHVACWTVSLDMPRLRLPGRSWILHAEDPDHLRHASDFFNSMRLRTFFWHPEPGFWPYSGHLLRFFRTIRAPVVSVLSGIAGLERRLDQAADSALREISAVSERMIAASHADIEELRSCGFSHADKLELLLEEDLPPGAVPPESFLDRVVLRYIEIAGDTKKIFSWNGGPAIPGPAPPRLELPRLNLDHLFTLTDDTGILQHARYAVPQRDHGYCTDDNARALTVASLALSMMPSRLDIRNLLVRYLSFLEQAQNKKTGRFRNFLSYDRQWLEKAGSEDCHARAVRGLAATCLRAPEAVKGVCLEMLDRAIPAMADFSHPRAWAGGILGIVDYLSCFGGDVSSRRVMEDLSGRLLDLLRRSATPEWPWAHDCLTYSNGKIPHALISAGALTGDREMIDAGLRSLAWVMDVQRDPAGHFVPIGNRGWYPQGGVRARFDQQPIEAMAMVESCLASWRITGDPKWSEDARTCFEWFLGRNDLAAPLYDERTGGCRDGLQPSGVNRNQGAESTLSWLLSLLRMHESYAQVPANRL